MDFTFALDSVQGLGTITGIWFEDGLELDDDDIDDIDEMGDVDMREGRGSKDPAGANGELDWSDTEARFGNQGGVSNGIDAGESLTIRFDADDDFFTEGLQALLAGTARLALHIQRLGADEDDSAHFVSTGQGTNTTAVSAPLPSAGLLAGAGLAITAGQRRRR